MALVLANRVQETATPNTTVSFTLTGAVAGFQTFAVIGNTNTTYYSAADGSGNWEVGLGTYSTTGPTLTRTTIYASSNSGLAVTFSGAVTVFVTYPSSKSVNLDDTGNVSALGTVSSGTWQGSTVGVAYGGTGVTASSGANSVMLRDSNQNVAINRLNQANTSTTATGGTTVLTAASSYSHTLVGTGNQTFTLPDATTLTTGVAFLFNNMATGTITIQDYASATVGTITAGGAGAVFLLNNSTVGGTWDVHGYLPEGVTWGTNALNLGSTVISNGTWQGGTIQSGYGGTGLTTFTGANNALYSTSASNLVAGTLPVAAGGTGLTSYTLNGVVYASGTGTLATSSALTFNGTNLINSGSYTAPSNGAGAGTKTSITGSTGTGQASATGGNGYIELIGGGGTSLWTNFVGSLGRRRGGVYLQAGTAQGDAGATYVNGSSIDIRGSNATNNGTTVGSGSAIAIAAGGATKIDGNNSSGGTISLGGGINSSAGSGSVGSGSFATSAGTNSGGFLQAVGATSLSGGDVKLLPGLAGISGSTAGKAYVVDPATSTNYEILTTGNITTAAITAATANSVPYFNGSKILTTGSTLTFDGATLGVNGISVGRGGGGINTNTVVGASALAANAAGDYNVAVGRQALNITNASGNTAVGTDTLVFNTLGASNSAFGYSVLFTNSSGNNNTAVGVSALQSNTTASNNTAVGYQAGYSNTTGEDNLFLGYQAGYSNTTGTLNTFLGRWAGKAVTTGNNNLMVGINTGYQSTGSDNTFVGARSTSGSSSCAEAMTTGSRNTILGAYNGNQGGLDIRTANNYIVLSDGDGNPRQIIDGSGNLGLGVTPSASWGTAGSAYKVLQYGVSGFLAGRTGNETALLGTGAYNDGTNWRYLLSGNFASYYSQASGNHIWYTAPSGTAGNAITFTQAMTLNASGNLGVGTTSPQLKLVVSNSGAQGFEVNPASTSISGGVDLLAYNRSTSAYAPINFDGSYHVFSTSNTERARITSGGDLLVGTTSSNGRLTVDSTSASTNQAVWAKNSGGTASTYIAWNAVTTGNPVFFDMYTEGSATQRGTISYNRGAGLVVYNTTSDYRAKDILGLLTDSGAVIDSVPVYMGKMKGATQERPMFIAHETPEYAHTGEKDAVDADGNPVYQQMDASALIPVMWAEIQSLRKRLAALEAK